MVGPLLELTKPTSRQWIPPRQARQRGKNGLLLADFFDFA